MNLKKSSASNQATHISALTLLALAVFPAYVSAQTGPRPDLEGMWIEGASAFMDPRWRLQDLVCYGCTGPAQDLLETMLAEEQLSRREYLTRMIEFDKEYISGLLTEKGREYIATVEIAPNPGCQPTGLIQHMRSRLAVKIDEFEDRITMQYEYLGPTRTVYMDGRNHPSDLEPSLLGHSVGWYDGPTLVIETTGIEPSVVRSSGIIDPIIISDRARIIERYTRLEGYEWYDYDATLVDPWMYRKPFVVHKQRRLLEHGVKFEIYDCEVVSGER